MKTQELKNKVEAQLIKWGNSPTDVKKMIDENFDLASKQSFGTNVKKISNYLRVIY